MRARTLRREFPSGIRAAAPRPTIKVAARERPILVLVEGIYDVEFLCRISAVLQGDNPAFPDLRTLEQAGKLIFVPFGGGDPGFWATRFAPLGLSEIHIYDRETLSDTELRVSAAASVNRRVNAEAFVMRRRSIENYLHTEVIETAFGIRATPSDNGDIVAAIADAILTRAAPDLECSQLSRRGRRRLKLQIKRKLNHGVVSNMTPTLLDESDPCGEIRSWLNAIAGAAGCFSGR